MYLVKSVLINLEQNEYYLCFICFRFIWDEFYIICFLYVCNCEEISSLFYIIRYFVGALFYIILYGYLHLVP
jgi:hypothetical protein